jgi:hypothetical protein
VGLDAHDAGRGPATATGEPDLEIDLGLERTARSAKKRSGVGQVLERAVQGAAIRIEDGNPVGWHT